jgi:hypothetical protein
MFEALPGFIKGWAITDIVFAGIWCAIALLWWTLALLLLCFGYMHEDIVLSVMQGAAAAACGGLGLYANILLLSKKPRAIAAGRGLIMLTILNILWGAFQGGLMAYWGPPHFFWVLVSVCTLVTGGRITLLVFYWIALVRAARYFEARRQQMGF